MGHCTTTSSCQDEYERLRETEITDSAMEEKIMSEPNAIKQSLLGTIEDSDLKLKLDIVLVNLMIAVEKRTYLKARKKAKHHLSPLLHAREDFKLLIETLEYGKQ